MSLRERIVGRFADRVTPGMLRQFLNAWPPLAAAGIRITDIASDWSGGRLELRVNRLNANMHGVAFGGTLFSMTDVLFGTLVMQRLGSEYEAWTRTGSFEFIRPGRRGTYLEVEVSDELIDQIHADLAGGYSTVVQYTSVVRDAGGGLVGIGHQDLYVRRRGGMKPPPNPNLVNRVAGENLIAAARTMARLGWRDELERLTEHERVARRCIDPRARAVAWLQGVPGADEDFIAAGMPPEVMDAINGKRTPESVPLLDEVDAARASLAQY
ncbi:DUF4442 domain-containing protein [Corynebacterium sp. TAE3-ERU12]|uniref:PaaI family thioesterase n=1 Tax=Corynebacterium sp. TAE3-ERU12 TaxID=2849491 RepID=UPI001C47755C|nr:DUF4442 domain-containing protein [Corynebacterium sp. TAE3-ERU12]MBV7295882.1 DUF4442 domain-containing protein [Corynebacterium sp. TAE3-ERU12]